MFESYRGRQNGGGSGALVDIAPLIDVVFILLIFFLVTATFVRPTGVTVDRPRARHVQRLAPQSMRIAVTESGALYTEGEQVDEVALRRRVAAFLDQHPEGAVVVAPDTDAAAGRVVAAMDAAKDAGAEDVSLATRRSE